MDKEASAVIWSKMGINALAVHRRQLLMEEETTIVRHGDEILKLSD